MEVMNPMVRAWKQEATDDPEGFWAKAADQLHWFRRWDSVLEWEAPTFRWFVGARTNLCFSAVDYHVAHGRAGHAALIAVDERGGRTVVTYGQLHREVERLAAALRGLGIEKGDRVAIYMPTTADAVALMLAIVRIGAIHIVVFAGFGAGALGERIALSGAKAVFTTDVTYRKGKDVPLKGIVDEAVAAPGAAVEKVVVLRRTGAEIPWQDGRDISWEYFCDLAAGHEGAYVEVEANEPAYILATSGTTAKPKLAVHTHGPYAVHIVSMARWVYGLRPDDVWWATSDIGWVVGHSYNVYAPLLMGCTSVLYEGALDQPGPDTFYRAIADNHVSAVFTSPTAARLLMRSGPEPARGPALPSVERVFCAGEVLNPPAWEWLQKEVFEDRVPVLDQIGRASCRERV